MSSGPCQNCGETTTRSCEKCNNHPQQTVADTWFCSDDCKQAQALMHRDTCKKRNLQRSLYRAGGVLQSLFYFIRAILYEKNLTDISHPQGKLCLHYGSHPGSPTPNSDLSDFLLSFPKAMFNVNDCDRYSVLTSLKCQEVVMLMYQLIDFFIGRKEPLLVCQRVG